MAAKSATSLSALRRCDFSTWWEGVSVGVLERIDLSAFERLCQVKVFLAWIQH